MNEMDFGRINPLSVPHWDSPDSDPSREDRPARTLTAEQIDALGEEERRYQAAELARAARPADPEADEAVDDDGGDDAERTRPQERTGLNEVVRQARARREAEAVARREAPQDQPTPAQPTPNGDAVARSPSSPLAAALESASRHVANADCPAGTDPADFADLKREVEYDVKAAASAVPREGNGAIFSPGLSVGSVLRYALARVVRPARDYVDWKARAFAAYVAQSDAYDALLGELIPDDFRDEARRHLRQVAYAVGTNGTARDDWDVFEARLKQRRADPLRGVTTGIRALDRSLGGGLSGTTFLAGVPGVGKSTLALAFALAALGKHPDLAVLFLSFDMPKDIIYTRLLSAESGVDYLVLMGGDLDEPAGQVNEAKLRLRGQALNRLRVVESTSLPRQEGFTAQWLAAQRRALAAATGARQVLHIADHFQHLDIVDEASNDLQKDERRLRALQCVQQSTRTAAHPAGDPMVLISKVRKDAGPTGLGIWDLLGKSDLTSGAEAVLCLEPDAVKGAASGPVVPVVVRVPKARDGATREPVRLLFEHTVSRFREAEPGRGGDSGAGARSAPSRNKPSPTAGKRKGV